MEPTTVVVPPGATVIVETAGADTVDGPPPDQGAMLSVADVAQLVRELDPQALREGVAARAPTFAEDPYAVSLEVIAGLIEQAAP